MEPLFAFWRRIGSLVLNGNGAGFDCVGVPMVGRSCYEVSGYAFVVWVMVELGGGLFWAMACR